jgi:hypothetical protein
VFWFHHKHVSQLTQQFKPLVDCENFKRSHSFDVLCQIPACVICEWYGRCKLPTLLVRGPRLNWL